MLLMQTWGNENGRIQNYRRGFGFANHDGSWNLVAYRTTNDGTGRHDEAANQRRWILVQLQLVQRRSTLRSTFSTTNNSAGT